MSPFSFLPGRSGTCAAALLITTSLLLGGCKAGEGRPRRPRKEGGGCRAGGNRQGRAPCGSRQLHRHRCAGAARRGASGGQDLGRCAVGDGGRRPEGVGGPGAGAPGSDRAHLAVAQSEAQLRKLENSYRRATQLVGQQLVSAADVDQLKFDVENSRAQHRLAALELSTPRCRRQSPA